MKRRRDRSGIRRHRSGRRRVRAPVEGDPPEIRDVGYDKSHAHDETAWCPENHLLRQLDFDAVTMHGNSPIVGRVLYCALP